jgi:hypothetical protein
MVRGLLSRPMAVRACRLLLLPDANTIKGEAVLSRGNFSEHLFCSNYRAYIIKVVLYA